MKVMVLAMLLAVSNVGDPDFKGRAMEEYLAKTGATYQVRQESFETLAKDLNKIVTICCYCGKYVGVKDGGNKISHGCCHKCYKEALKEIKRDMRDLKRAEKELQHSRDAERMA